ncbi:MAG TPA: sigma-70 family RNA polymerase sigma factor [Candidatus Binatia bacterium]|nr:sigma-70 family RNA polymerase sigma factor [Candidatus Binatia bacterium]
MGHPKTPSAVDSNIDSRFSEVSAAVVEHLPHLRAFARSLASTRDQADDLVGEAVARALAAAHQFRPGTNFKAWIFTILRNAFYTEGRKRWNRVVALDDNIYNQPSIGPTQEDSLSFCDFRRAFIQLSPRQREVLMLVGNGDLSYEEVAEHCRCPVGTVKSRVSRARLDLKRILDEELMVQPRRSVPPVADADLTDTLDETPEIKIRPRRRSRSQAEERRVVN